MTGKTSSKLGAVAMVALLVASLLTVAVAPAMAAAGNVEIGSTSYSVDEDRSEDVTVDVTADADGISNETLELDVTDSDGNVVHTHSKTIDVAADSTETFTFTVDPEAESLAPGNYTLDAAAGGVTSGTSDLTVDDVQEPSASWSQTGYELFQSGGDSNTVEYTLDAGDRDQTSNVTVSVTDPDGNTAFETIEQDVSVSAGNTTTGTVTLSSSDVDMTGTHSLSVDWSGATMTTDLNVSDPSDPTIRADTEAVSMYNESDAQDLPVTLAAGDYNQTGDLTVTITDDETGDVAYETTKASVSVVAGETKSTSFTVTSDDLDAGNYSVAYSWEGASAQSDLTVEEGEGDTVFAGGAVGGAGVAGIIVLIGALISIALGVAAFRER